MQRRFKPKLFRDLDHPIFATDPMALRPCAATTTDANDLALDNLPRSGCRCGDRLQRKFHQTLYNRGAFRVIPTGRRVGSAHDTRCHQLKDEIDAGFNCRIYRMITRSSSKDSRSFFHSICPGGPGWTYRRRFWAKLWPPRGEPLTRENRGCLAVRRPRL